MIRLKAMMTFEYDANPDDYGTRVPKKMARIDRDNFNSDPAFFFECAERLACKIEVEPVTNSTAGSGALK